MSSDYEFFTSSPKGMERGLWVLIYFLNNREKKILPEGCKRNKKENKC